MKVKGISVLLAIAIVGVFALPATAATSTTSDAGVFVGTADVGKGASSCAADGSGSVSGGGIGLPVLQPKTASYRIDAAPGAVTSASHGAGSLKLCGTLVAPLSTLSMGTTDAVGASCAATEGNGGKGKATFAGPVEIWLKNLGWPATAGGTFVVTADAAGASGKATNKLAAVVQALSDTVVVGCLNKGVLNDKSNIQPFTVVAAYAIV